MTRRTNARVAGYAFLLYIAAGLGALFLQRGSASGETTAAMLASVAQHAGALRLALVLEMIGCFCALVLAVTLYAITRDQDADLALLVAVFRVAEGVVGAVSLNRAAARLWLATTAERPDAAATEALGAWLLKLRESPDVGATFFAVGSTIFAWLLLRGRIVPAPLAWIGLAGSILAVVVLPLHLVGLAHSPLTDVMWLPLLVFEVWLALRFIRKGAAIPSGAAART